MAPALSRPTPRFALSHSARKPEIARSPRRYERLRVCAVAEFVGKAAGIRSEALLIHKFTAHTSSLAAALVLRDTEDSKQVVTSSLDKSLALWQQAGGDDLGTGGFVEAARLTPPGGPIFSLALDTREQDGLPNQVFVGNHAKQVAVWVPPAAQLDSNVVLDDHCGWVRSLAIAQGRWLFSCACNTLRQWDMSRAVPRCTATVSLDKGDILALVARKDRIYAANADGSIRAWSIGKKGELQEVACRKKAHGERVTAIALKGGLLYSVSYDGGLKAWDADSLEIVVDRSSAHGGERVHCLATGPDGLLYTGGDDKLVRRWEPTLLQPAAPPLLCHNHSVRSLAAGGHELLVSGDKGGEVAVWKV
ncbi:hypothetical protein ABPG77_001396 [Micractinium sp. CCAP 211/92]